MQFSASEKTDGGGEKRDWEKEYKVKDEEGEKEKKWKEK